MWKFTEANEVQFVVDFVSINPGNPDFRFLLVCIFLQQTRGKSDMTTVTVSMNKATAYGE